VCHALLRCAREVCGSAETSVGAGESNGSDSRQTGGSRACDIERGRRIKIQAWRGVRGDEGASRSRVRTPGDLLFAVRWEIMKTKRKQTKKVAFVFVPCMNQPARSVRPLNRAQTFRAPTVTHTHNETHQ